ncbi:MAG: hypothetical protein DBY27_01690 [Clostridiaceae bacterium]|nr:MAG: hypothetical protein DBY27_01690 [Clostridiaceae bacterium]
MCTTRKWKQYIENPAERVRLEKIPKVHYYVLSEFSIQKIPETHYFVFCKFILFSLILLLACFIFAFLVSAFGMPCFCCSSSAFDLRVFIFLPQ